jgi:hypothetical protein
LERLTKHRQELGTLDDLSGVHHDRALAQVRDSEKD